MSSDGEVQGVGLLIASDPSSGKLVVLAPIVGGPADRAGMLPGDEVAPPASFPQLLFHFDFTVTVVSTWSCKSCVFIIGFYALSGSQGPS